TVRKVAEELLSRRVLEKRPPLGLLPFGTANNIAKTLGLRGSVAQIAQGWHNASIKRFDVGVIDGLDRSMFFLESFGYGLFPKLMKEMDERGWDEIEDPKERLKVALRALHDLVLKAPLKQCDLQI